MDYEISSVRAVLLANLAVALYMTGVIWFVQIVHYPLFARVGEAGFGAYEAAHASLTTIVVGPAMVAELALAVGLLFFRPAQASVVAVWIALALAVLIWISTFALQVPQHAILSSGFDQRAYETLVRTNWIRTIAWTLRSGILFFLAFRTF